MKSVFVTSGKGGTGKTLISVNLAYQLKQRGKSVGLLDADLDSPNLCEIIGIEGVMDVSGERFHPKVHEGMQIFSMSLLVGDKPVYMEGSQHSEMIRDAVKATDWGCEYLIVDHPPSSSDILRKSLEMFQDSLLGVVIVSQPAHPIDTRRQICLFKDLGVRIIGVIENMSFLKVGKGTWKIFGESRLDEIAKEYEVDILGRIPLSMEIRRLVEAKKPFLTGEMAEPIEKTVEKILTLQPEKPGFLAKVKDWIKTQVDRALTTLIIAVNEEIDISGIKSQFGYPGGSVIQLNIMREDMQTVISSWSFMVYEDKIVAVEGNPAPDYRIDIWIDAIKHGILRDRRLSDGSVYDFEAALRLGHMRLFGDLSMARGARFLKEVFARLAENEKAVNRVRPLLEVL